MKKTILISLFIFGIYSCTRENYDEHEYTIRNESGKTVTIKSYLSSFPNVPPIITNLSISEELTKTETTKYSYTYANFFGKNDSSRDSINIIYGSSKIDFFNTNECENDRNPLNLCEYGDLKEVFIFTEQDYQNAEDCNGNCD